MDGDYGSEHYKSILVDIEWEEPNVNPRLADAGVEKKLTHQITITVREELKLPNNTDDTAKWATREDLHPFWVMKRQKQGEEINCKLMNQMIALHTHMDWDDLGRQGAKITGLEGVRAYVWYPFIVNTRQINKGEEVVLQFDREFEKKKGIKRKDQNAFDQVKDREAKASKDRKRLPPQAGSSSSISFFTASSSP